MYQMKIKVFFIVLMVASLNTFAENVTTTTSITKMYTYGEDTGALHNDIVIKVANPVAGCEGGFWLRSTDNLGNKNIAAFLLSAFHGNSKVYFGAYSNQRWSGSTGKYCKIHTIGIEK